MVNKAAVCCWVITVTGSDSRPEVLTSPNVVVTMACDGATVMTVVTSGVLMTVLTSDLGVLMTVLTSDPRVVIAVTKLLDKDCISPAVAPDSLDISSLEETVVVLIGLGFGFTELFNGFGAEKTEVIPSLVV